MKKLLFLIMLFCSISVFAQEEKYQLSDDDYQNEKVEMADTMRQSGKIYVVVAVVITIFAGLVFYLVRLDKKVSQLEQDITAQGKEEA